MSTTYMIYLIEIIVAAFLLIAGNITLKLLNKNIKLKFTLICVIALILALGANFVLEKPKMFVGEPKTVEVMSGKIEAMPSTTYHFSNVTDKVRINGNVDYNKIGEYEVLYEIDTLTGKYSEAGKIIVADTKKPEIILEGDDEIKQSYAKEYEEQGFKAIDEYDGDITDKVVTNRQNLDEMNFNVIYEVQDSSGNKAEKTRRVTLIDDVSPTITLKGKTADTIYIGGKYTESGAKAIDEKDGDVTDKIKIDGNVDTSKEGTYTVTYTVTDNSGNEAVAKRTITVKKQVKVQQTTTTTQTSKQGSSGGGKGIIYLTFDDGPSTSITPKVLDILKAKNVKATFFILNYDSAGEKLVKRAYAEGHTIAIHGYSHQYSEIYKSEDAYMKNITKLQEKIKDSTGYNATITRFPGGSSNTVSRFNKGIMTRLTKLVVSKGYKYFDWNVSSGDAGGARTKEEVYNNVVNGLRKSRANVVLMHDFSGNYKTLNALSDIIDYGLQNGYTFNRITESTPMVTHGVNN